MNSSRKILNGAIISLLIFSCKSEAQNTRLSVKEFEKAIQQKNIQVLDVRTFAEYQSGHLANAFLADWTNMTEFTERVAELDKSKPLYVYCLSGGRSDGATNWLNKNGYTAYSLAGGINAWKREDKPLESARPTKQLSMEAYIDSIPANKTVLVDFSAPWCPPCKKMEPVLNKLKKEHGGEFVFIQIDGSAQTTLCKSLQIAVFPTFILYKKGKQVWRKEGIVEMNEFVKEL